MEQDIYLDQVGSLLASFLVVQRSVTLGARLQHIEEVKDDLTQWHGVAQLHAVLRQVVHATHLTTLGLTQLHCRSHKFARNNDGDLHDGLVNFTELSARPVRWVMDAEFLACLIDNAVVNRRRCGNQIEAKLTLESVTGDFHVQQSEEATSETKAQSYGCFRFVREGGVVKLQLFKRIAQVGEIRLGNWEQARINHRRWFLVAAQWLLRTMDCPRDGIADLGLAHIFHASDQVTNLARSKTRALFRGGAHDANFQQFVGGSSGHHLDLLARCQLAVHHANVGNHTAVGVIDGVENHRTSWGVFLKFRGRCWNKFNDLIQKLRDTHASFTGHAQHIFRFTTHNVGDLQRVLVWIRRWKVNLIQHRDDLKIVFHSQVQVCQGLGFNALRCINKQNRAFTRFKRTGDFISKVHVAWRIDHLHDDLLALVLTTARNPWQANVLSLNGNAAFTFDVHVVQVLITHIAGIHNVRQLQDTVSERRFTVVNVGNDAEVTNPGWIRKCCFCKFLCHMRQGSLQLNNGVLLYLSKPKQLNSPELPNHQQFSTGSLTP